MVPVIPYGHFVTVMPSNANSMRTERMAPVSEENFLDPVDQRDQNAMEVSLLIASLPASGHTVLTLI